MSVSCHFQSCKALLRIVKRRYVKYHAFAFAFLWTAGRSPTYRCKMRTADIYLFLNAAQRESFSPSGSKIVTGDKFSSLDHPVVVLKDALPSTTFRQRYDHSTTFATTVGTAA